VISWYKKEKKRPQKTQIQESFDLEVRITKLPEFQEFIFSDCICIQCISIATVLYINYESVKTRHQSWNKNKVFKKSKLMALKTPT